jgi:hypothetical protein
MNYIITEESLIGYLTNEMDAPEKKLFEKALQESPKWQEELKQMSFLKKQLGLIQDEKPPQRVIIPTEALPLKRSVLRWIMPIASIAAGIAFLMILASVVNMQFDKYDGGLSISFGDARVEQMNTSTNSKQDLEQILTSILDERDQQWQTQLAGMEASINQKVSDQESTLEDVSHHVRNINKSPKANYITYEQMNDFLVKTRTEDKDDVEKMIANLFEYMSITHDKDLQMIQAGFNDLRQTINLSELERQQLLASYQDNNLNQ